MKRIWFFMISALLLFSAAGSRDTIASLDRAMVHAVGIDRSEEGYSVTLQVFRPDSAGSETQLDAGKANIFVITASAPTVGEAMTACENRLGEFLFIGHGQIILLGEGVSVGDPKSLFSYFLASKESYLGIKLACTDGKASELLSAELSEGAVAAQNIVSIIERHSENSATVDCCLLDVLGCGECPAVMPLLKLTEASEGQKGSGGNESGSSEGSSSEPKQTVSAEGAEVFSHGKRVMHLSAEDCSVLALFNKEEQRIMLEEKTGSEGSAVTVRDDCPAKSLVRDGDILRCRFELKTCIKPDQSLEALFDLSELESSCEQELQRRCDSLAARCYGSEKLDLFGISTMVRSRFPQVWLDCGGDPERILDHCETAIEVKCEVK